MLAMTASAALAQGDGPFCVHTTNLQQCLYYSADECQAAARLANGTCAPNSSKSPPKPAPATGPLEAMAHVTESGNKGREQGEQRRAFAEQVEAQKAADGVAQWAAVAADAEAASTKGKPLFRCDTPDGGSVVTSEPEPGCVYLGVGE